MMMTGGQGMTKQYTTISGDMWDGIAFKILGDEKYMDKLIKLNIKHKDIIVFSAGVILDIPEKENEISEQLPPWKRMLYE